MMFVFTVLFTIFIFDNTKAWPRGAGDEACGDLTPRHHEAVSQRPGPDGKVPFEITYRCGKDVNTYEVSIEGPLFHGFLLQARPEYSDSAYGSWNVHENYEKDSKVKQCSSGLPDSLTHSHPGPKKVTGIWKPPTDIKAQFYFVGTVVESFQVFWVNISVKAKYPCVSTPELNESSTNASTAPSTESQSSSGSSTATDISKVPSTYSADNTSGNETTTTTAGLSNYTTTGSLVGNSTTPDISSAGFSSIVSGSVLNSETPAPSNNLTDSLSTLASTNLTESSNQTSSVLPTTSS